MPDYNNMRNLLRSMPLFNSHEHHTGLNQLEKSLPWYDFLNGVNGMVFAEIMSACGTSLGDISYEKLKEDHIAEALPSALTTGNGLALKLFAREFLNIDEVSNESLPALNKGINELVNELGAEKLYREMCSRTGIRWIVNDDYRHMPPSEDSMKRDFPEFVYNTVRIDPLIDPESPQKLRETEKNYDCSITSFTTLVSALEQHLEDLRDNDRVVSLKSAMAYVRTLEVGEPSFSEAEKEFDKMALGKSYDRIVLMDYLLNTAFQRAGEYDLPFQLHSGFSAAIYGDFRKGDPTNLIPALNRHRKTRFVLFHSSWPYSDVLGAMGKAFPNLWIDMSWSWNLAPLAMKQQLQGWLSSIPSNKITAFGGDSWTPVWSAAGALLAKRGVADTLTALIEQDYLNEKEAVATAERLLYKNGLDLYNIDGERN